MAANTLNVRPTLSGNTRRGPSYEIWGDCPLAEYHEDPGIGTLYRQFFQEPNFLTTTITTMAALGSFGLKAFASTASVDILPVAQGGLALFETDDNEGASVQAYAYPFRIIRGGGDLWFEARVKHSVITDNEQGFFIGLAESLTLSATVPIAAAGTLADVNFVGFHRLEGDGDQIDTVYKADGVTQVTVKADAMPTALVPDTYTKVGMRYTDRNHRLSFYQNGVLLPDYVTVPSAAGTSFPNDIFLSFVFAVLNASANDSTCTLNWIQIFQTATS